MPLRYTRTLTDSVRTQKADKQIGTLLAFVAGAINAGGFLAVHQYTSHMTGIVSTMADQLILGAYDLVLAGMAALICFMCGSVCTTIMVNYARVHHMRSEYALPLLLEAVLLLCFGMLGARIAQMHGLFVPITVMILSFLMGLQNALITKLSRSVIRTTHVTGIVTDIGIELGKLFYWNRGRMREDSHFVMADRARLRLHCALLVAFFAGGTMGAWGFNHIGYIATVPLACLLVLISGIPAFDDIRAWLTNRRRPAE
ncbi:YoaK family protein [Advenella kashmirensis]